MFRHMRPSVASSARAGRAPSELAPPLDAGERVLAARERAADRDAVAVLELRIHVGGLVGWDRAGQAGDRDQVRGQLRDRAACAARPGPGPSSPAEPPEVPPSLAPLNSFPAVKPDDRFASSLASVP